MSRRPPSRRRPQGDDGTVLLLVLGFTGVLMGLLAVVADVSVALLAQRGVASEADGAAIAASQELDETTFYASGLGDCLPLDQGEVRAAVARYRVAAGTGTALSARTADATTVEVRAARQVRLPVSHFVTGRTITVRSVARATSPVAGAGGC